ncbi:DUF2955 domain-containing protein [Variovorax sp. YR216]|uniref:DUF2955 domain-containing protein n=1 Tax=Variovorax sp. YR216 TaxID=1882828 RepID=UPI0008977699|nr:DUF2955 domain-containing protein [Variovorax sp. YR216]SEA21511.1 Protein of unknown function [Variovorax sp. YR216]
MTRGDKASLRLTLGLGLATLLAYGLALKLPFVVCVMAVLVLCKPGPPLPLVKGIVAAVVLAALIAAGVLMVPLLEHYAVAGVLLTGVVLHAVFHAGQRGGGALTVLLVISFAMMPVAGVAEQSLIAVLSVTLAVGLGVGTLVSALSGALFPDPPPQQAGAAAPRAGAISANWIALRGTIIVMPVFVLALTNPSFYLAAVMKTATLAQQAGEAQAGAASRELVGSTLMGAFIGMGVWMGLSLWPSLWMLMLWLMAAALWTGSAMFGVRRTRFRPSFWSNALVTALILLGPAIEDSASGKSVLEGSVMRVCLFVGVAFYASATVWVLERWRRRSLQPVSRPDVHRASAK